MRFLLCAVAVLSLSNSIEARVPGGFTNHAIVAPSVFAVPAVTTAPAAQVSFTTATLGGNVTASGGPAVTERGFVWNTVPAATLSDNKIVAGQGTGVFSKAFAGAFPPNTLIYVRAYATNSQGTAYGNEISFTTTALSGTSAIYDFEPASGTLSGFDTHTLTATHAASSSALQITAVADYVYRSTDFGLFENQGHIGTEGLYFGLEAQETSVTFSMQGGRSFDLAGFYFTHEKNDPTNYIISTSKGSFSIAYPELTSVLTYEFIDIAANAAAASFTGITSFTITAASGSFFEIDNLVLQNITGSTLPVTLLDFNAHVQGDNVQLEWDVADETAFRQFEVERSFNGTDFSKIGVVGASGSTRHSYNYMDKMPNASSVFYRLKMLDLDGSFVYSRLIGIRPDNSGWIELFPNPAASTLQLALPQTAGGLQKIVLFNTHGQVLKTKSYHNSSPTTVSLDVSDLPAGKYFLRIVQANGSVTRQFIKQ